MYNLIMEKIELGLPQTPEIAPVKVIDVELINNILGTLKSFVYTQEHAHTNDFSSSHKNHSYNYESGYDRIVANRQSPEGRDLAYQLAHIFSDLYSEDSTEDKYYSDNSERFDDSGTWLNHHFRGNDVLLSSLNTLLEYKDTIGLIGFRRIVIDIATRWEVVMSMIEEDNLFQGDSLYTKMQQVVFAALSSYASKSNEDFGLKFDDLLRIDVIDETSEGLSKNDVLTMEKIYSANYFDKPELRDVLLEKFKKNLTSNPGTFVTVRFDGEIIGYYELDSVGTNKIHFGKFNVAPGLEGIGLGTLLLDKRLNIDAKNNIVLAECDLFAGISRKYLKDGSIGYKTTEIGEIFALSIARNDSVNNLFKSKILKDDDVYTKDPQPDLLDENYEILGGDVVVVKGSWYVDPNIAGASSDIEKRLSELLDGKLNGSKYVITHIFEREINPEDRECATYFVLEAIKDEDLESYLNRFEKIE